MKSSVHGNGILDVEVTSISTYGIRLYSHGKELFMSYEEFPWFKNQTVKSIINVEEVTSGHFHWPDIDVDLTEEMIEHPNRFPLKANHTLSDGCPSTGSGTVL